MKKPFIILVASLTLSFAAPIVVAADASLDKARPAPFEQAREKLNKMTPEERKAFMKEVRVKWDKLSPEQKMKFKIEMREKMHLMKKQQAERKMVRIYSLYLLEQQQQ